MSEYDLVQLFNPYGKISKLDLLFHKAGPFKGKPRGYAFVEYMKEEDAALAKVEMEGKEVRGRKVAVSFANKVSQGGGRRVVNCTVRLILSARSTPV